MNQDTIAAIATASGQGGIGIIRISGNKALQILQDVFRPAGGKRLMLENNRLTYGHIYDGDEEIDECMAVIMRAPKSYTREDVAEIQIHGGTQVTRRMLETCLKKGARLAAPGEFTRRAFLNGRIDLSQAEAVMCLIASQGEQARKAAVRQMEGGTAEFVRQASDKLYKLQAGLAACIDYPEEISDEEGAGELRKGLRELISELKRSIDERSSRLIHDGMHVTLFGIPNVGKSSLLNALAGIDKAIVTDIPGTTRDIVESEIQIDGIRVYLTDTAGMRETADPIERIGVEKSELALRSADVALLVLDGSKELSQEEIYRIRRLHQDDVVLINKSDQKVIVTEDKIHAIDKCARCMTVSALKPESLKPVYDYFREKAEVFQQASVTQPRHLNAVKKAISFLENADETLNSFSPDLAATDLQAAQNALSEITGDHADEKLLDAIFSGFCVGK